MNGIQKIYLALTKKMISAAYLRQQAALLFIFQFFATASSLALPYLSKLLIDKSFLARDPKIFVRLAFVSAAVFIFSALFKILEDTLRNRIITKTRLELSNRILKGLYYLDLTFFQEKSSIGENIYRISDAEKVTWFIYERLPKFLVDVLKLSIILGVCLWINFRLSAVLIILSPLFLFRSMYVSRKQRPIFEELWRVRARLIKRLQESFAKIIIIKALKLEVSERHLYMRILIENLRLGLKGFRWSLISSLSSTFLSKAVYGAVSLYGGWLIIKGRMSLGSYTATMIYLTQFGGLLQSLSSSYEYFVQDAVSVEKFFEIIQMRPRIQDAKAAVYLPVVINEIKLRNVSFGYQVGKAVLKDLDFNIPADKWIGIVGASGSGKTTLISLILRLYDPWQGEILLDSLDLRRIRLDSLRAKITIATQEPFLFDFSIKENISCGLGDITDESIREAGQITQLDDYVKQLPKGYDTLIGEDACRLSQGLKQRVALARAVVRESALLILDEATSSIDSATEERIFTVLRQKRKERGTVIVSHRLFSIKDADRIFYLRQDGKVESGSHEELLVKSNFYREFFHNQLGVPSAVERLY